MQKSIVALNYQVEGLHSANNHEPQGNDIKLNDSNPFNFNLKNISRS